MGFGERLTLPLSGRQRVWGGEAEHQGWPVHSSGRLAVNLRVDTLLKCLLGQGIEAFTLRLRRHRKSFMELGRNP